MSKYSKIDIQNMNHASANEARMIVNKLTGINRAGELTPNQAREKAIKLMKEANVTEVLNVIVEEVTNDQTK